MDNFQKFSKDKLPDKCNFFSFLKDECVSEKDYKIAIDVWNVFKINAIGDYHDVYLKTDVLLLADVFEKFISTCLDYYGLDPCHYFSSLGLSWDAMLKMTRIELKLISNIDMHLFIEKGMRGGISYIAKRHSKTSNKYIKCYVSGEESKYIMYLDANNLYGYAIIQYLPYSEFIWLNKKEIVRSDVDSIGENSFIGYIFAVDLNYSDDLHELIIHYLQKNLKLLVICCQIIFGILQMNM